MDIVIYVRDGMIEEVAVPQGETVNVLVVDYDTDGLLDEDIVSVLGEKCFVYSPSFFWDEGEYSAALQAHEGNQCIEKD